MSALNILKALVSGGLSVAGACAMGGNMQAESCLSAINLQDSYEKSLGYNDASYTAAVDNGSYSMERFIKDQAGYGLCQWTFGARKSNLYAFAKASGASIGSEDMQTQFCLAELAVDYPALYAYLKTTDDIDTATSRICVEFEQPAVNNISVRTKFAYQLYSQYGSQLQSTMGQVKSSTAPTTIDKPVSDAEPRSYILGEVSDGRTPESLHMAALINKLGYDVLWSGLEACIKDYQAKCGLPVTGKGDTATWDSLLKG